MTVFHLVRHGITDSTPGVLSGRTPGVRLHEEAAAQIEAVAERLAGEPVSRIYSSPLERTRETARRLAERFALTVQLADELLELDYGQWTGQRYEQLRSTSHWEHFNHFRSGTQIPGGEWMLNVQARACLFMLGLRDQLPNETVVLVSHGDVIRAAVVFFLGAPLDLLPRLEIGLASLSSIRIDAAGVQITALNWTAPPG